MISMYTITIYMCLPKRFSFKTLLGDIEMARDKSLLSRIVTKSLSAHKNIYVYYGKYILSRIKDKCRQFGGIKSTASM